MKGNPVNHVRKRISWKKVGIAAGILGVIVLGIILLTNSPKITANSIKLDYTLKTEEGTVIAKNVSTFRIGSVAQELGLASAKLDTEIASLNKGQSRTIILEAEDGFGEYDPTAVYIQPTKIERNVRIDRIVTYPLAAVEQYFGEDPVIGKTYDIKGANWNYTVMSKNSDNVTLRIDTYVGKEIASNFIISRVAQISDTKISMFLSSTEDIAEDAIGPFTITSDASYIYLKYSDLPETKDFGYFVGRLSDNGTAIIIDANSPYAGKKVVVEVKVIDINKKAVSSTAKIISDAKKNDGPVLQTFVMTHCPYGTQMEKAVLPAYELLKDKANFEIRFVHYTMHGPKEDTETKRQLCIREETNKFWSYLSCFIQDETYADKCMSEVGIDKSKIEECMKSRADKYWDADKELNSQYGVQGSPTTVLDGKEVSLTRTPEAIKQAVCNAFTNKPSECSQALSTRSPAPGFGTSASSGSGTAAQCG